MAKDEFTFLSKTEGCIMELLCSSARQLYGLEMVENSAGRLKRGTVYVILNRMEEKGFLTSKQEEATGRERGIPKRLYKPTGLGERAFRAWQRAHEEFQGRSALA